MIEEIKLVGKCPIGELYKRIKIDRFGFISRVEYFKELVPAWRSYTAFGGDICGSEEYTYSDTVYYNKKDENGVTIYENLVKNPKTLGELRKACGVC